MASIDKGYITCSEITAHGIADNSRGWILYGADSIGKNNITFRIPKFGTRRIDIPPIATHLLSNPDQYLTSVENFFRKSSLDELSQLLSSLNET